MSWGLEGAIRFWNQEGQTIQGGDPTAHPYGVEGTIGLENGRGELGPRGRNPLLEPGRPVNPGGGDPAAHPKGALGVHGLENGRLVSWGLDGAIRFWGQEGQPIPGGRPRRASEGGLGRARPRGWTLGELGPRGRDPLLESGRSANPGGRARGASQGGLLACSASRMDAW